MDRELTGKRGHQQGLPTRRPLTYVAGQGPFVLAVGVGFEPTVTRATTVFKIASGHE
jgi:hypothetical protein